MAAAAGAAIVRGRKGPPRFWGALGRSWQPLAAAFSSQPGGAPGGSGPPPIQAAHLADSLLCQMDQRDTWDRFYAAQSAGAAGPRHFDWFFGYREVAGLLLTHLQGLPPGPARVLDVGCGTSGLGLGLLRDCPRRLRVSCLDFSPAALAALRRLLREGPPPRHPLSRLRCHLADATRLAGAFSLRSFHLVLDKGTCDALLRGPRGPGRAGGLVAACLALLRPGGRLLQFSDEDPDARAPFLERAGGVPVAVHEVGCFGGIRYYAYSLGPQAPDPPASCGADG